MFKRKSKTPEEIMIQVPNNTPSQARTATNKQLLEKHWDSVIFEISTLFKEPILYYPEEQPVLLKQLTDLQISMLDIDVSNIEDAHLNALNFISFTRIPNLVESINLLKISSSSTTQNKEAKFNFIMSEVRIMGETVLRISAAAKANALRYISVDNPGASAFQAFPSAPEGSSELVRTLLKEISILWEHEQGESHSTENQYVLEKIVNDYVPTSLSLYSRFLVSSSTAVKEQAEVALVEQLKLVKSHIEEISEIALMAKMSSMNAQTDFLRQRLDNQELI